MAHGCTHTEITKVLTLGECDLHAGSEMQIRNQGHKFDLVISLTGHSVRKPVNFRMSIGSLRTFAALNSYAKRKKHTIVIDWPDMSAPDLDAEFWQALHADLVNFSGRAVIHCLGGHGRTGTALAILAYLDGLTIGQADPVTWVREKYCQAAVETTSQIEYLRNEIGLVTTAAPSSASRYEWSTDREPIEGSTIGLRKYFDKAGKFEARNFPTIAADVED